MSYDNTLKNQNYFAELALARAAQRNGGQNIPATNPTSCTVYDNTSIVAVDKPVRGVGSEGGE